MTAKVNIAKIRYIRSNLLRWIKNNKRAFPWRKKSITPYQFLVAEIMLKKTNARGVVNIYKKFISQYPTPNELAKAKVSKIKKIVTPLGLYRSRSLLLKNIAKVLTQNNEIFRNREDLLKINGLGQYIVNAYFVFVLGQRVPIVDRNVLRIYSRYFGIRFRNDPRRDKKIDTVALRCLPFKGYKEFNYALLDLSAAVCNSNKPHCSICPIRRYCDYTKTR